MSPEERFVQYAKIALIFIGGMGIIAALGLILNQLVHIDFVLQSMVK